jgi:hypothetical protein
LAETMAVARIGERYARMVVRRWGRPAGDVGVIGVASGWWIDVLFPPFSDLAPLGGFVEGGVALAVVVSVAVGVDCRIRFGYNTKLFHDVFGRGRCLKREGER